MSENIHKNFSVKKVSKEVASLHEVLEAREIQITWLYAETKQ